MVAPPFLIGGLDVRIAVVLALVLLGGLQYRLWVGDGSLAELWRLHQAVEQQQTENARLKERNQRLAAEVTDLKYGLEALEARARHELGLIGENETFFQYTSETPQ